MDHNDNIGADKIEEGGPSVSNERSCGWYAEDSSDRIGLRPPHVREIILPAATTGLVDSAISTGDTGYEYRRLYGSKGGWQ
jgi:hypothetical protein